MSLKYWQRTGNDDRFRMRKEVGFPNCLCQTWLKAATKMMNGEWQMVNGEGTTPGGSQRLAKGHADAKRLRCIPTPFTPDQTFNGQSDLWLPIILWPSIVRNVNFLSNLYLYKGLSSKSRQYIRSASAWKLSRLTLSA